MSQPKFFMVISQSGRTASGMIGEDEAYALADTLAARHKGKSFYIVEQVAKF